MWNTSYVTLDVAYISSQATSNISKLQLKHLNIIFNVYAKSQH